MGIDYDGIRPKMIAYVVTSAHAFVYARFVVLIRVIAKTIRQTICVTNASNHLVSALMNLVITAVILLVVVIRVTTMVKQVNLRKYLLP